MGFWGDQWNTVSGGATAGAYGLGQGLLDGRIGDIVSIFYWACSADLTALFSSIVRYN